MRDHVKEGYEKGDYKGEYREGRELQESEEKLLGKAFDMIPEDAKFLDLGCGYGLPFDRYIMDHGYSLTGLDIAEKHVEGARKNLPEAEFIQGDFFEQDFEENSFDAVVSFYAIFHIPRDEHLELFQKMRKWVKEDGVILVTMGASEMDQHKGDIGGVEILWSSYSKQKNREIVEEAGFEIVETYLEDWRDTEESHYGILARN